MAYDNIYHGGICHSKEIRMRRFLYTVAIEISNTLCQMMWSFAIYHLPLYCIQKVHVVTRSFAILSVHSFEFNLSQCTKASHHGGKCHCGHGVLHAIEIQSGIFVCVYQARKFLN